MYYAQLTNKIVTSVTESSDVLTGDNLVEIDSFDTSLIGCKYTNGKFVRPKPVVDRAIPAGAFRLRFNFSERAAIEVASVINPAGTDAERTTQATVKTFYADLCSQRYINLDSAGVLRGCMLLESLGILEQGWKARIIDPDPTTDERAFGA